MRPEKWELYLPITDVWIRCPLDRAIVWMKGGGLVKCYR